MTISEWLYNKLSTTSILTDVVGTNIDPDGLTFGSGVTYRFLAMVKKNKTIRQETYSIMGFQDTKAETEILNYIIYQMFDNSFTSLREESGDVLIIDVEIVNNITSLYDDVNKKFYCVTDILVTYIRG